MYTNKNIIIRSILIKQKFKIRFENVYGRQIYNIINYKLLSCSIIVFKNNMNYSILSLPEKYRYFNFSQKYFF